MAGANKHTGRDRGAPRNRRCRSPVAHIEEHGRQRLHGDPELLLGIWDYLGSRGGFKPSSALLKKQHQPQPRQTGQGQHIASRSLDKQVESGYAAPVQHPTPR